jgi:hypothetical protein
MANKTSSFLDNSPPKVDQIWLNMVNGEIANAIPMAGDAVDSTGLVNDQLSKSIKSYVSQAGILCTDTSSGANVYIVNASTPFTNPVLKTGTRIRFKTANANTGSSTITAFGGSQITCKKSDGSTNLASGDILANTEVEFVYNGTNWVQGMIGNSNLTFLANLPSAKASTTNQGVSYLNNPITIANNASDANNDIDFSAGNAPFDDGSGQVLLSSTLVKRLDASWVAGTNQGGLFSGTKANSTRYYLFSITNGTIIDAGFDISPTGANIPAGYKGSYRGMVLTDGSGNIRPFTLVGQYMSYVNEITDYTPTPTSDVYQTYALSCPLKPNILAYIRMRMAYTGAGVVPQDFTYRNTGQTTGGNFFGGGAVNGFQAQNPTGFVPLNSSAQVDLAFGYVAPSNNFQILTKGYFDFNIKL